MNIPSQNQSFWHKYVSFVRQSSEIYYAIAVVAILAAGGAYYGFSYLRSNKQEQAQRALFGCIEQYEKMAQDKNPDWDSFNKLVTSALAQQDNSNAAPYLLALQSDVDFAKSNKDESLALLGKAIDAMPSSSSLYYLYKTKYALMQMDSMQPDVTQQGLALLKSLAADAGNKNSDQAMYYVGFYYWSLNDMLQAQNAWQPLLEMPFEGDGGSPWAKRAQEKMKLV